MITVVVGERTQDRVARELSDREQHRIAVALAQQGIRIEPVTDPFGTLHLNACRPALTPGGPHTDRPSVAVGSVLLFGAVALLAVLAVIR